MSIELKKVEARIKALEKKDKEYDIKIANNTQELESLDKWLKANILNVSKPYYQSQESRRSDYAEENRQWNEHKKLFQQGLKEAKAEKAKITAKAVRSEMSAIVLEMNKQCKKGARAIRSAFKPIQNLGGLEKAIFAKKDEAADWPVDVFHYKKPGEASFHFAICCIAKEFGLDSRTPIEIPNPKKCLEGSTFEGAFKSFKYLRDSWEYPERFEEIDPETIEYEAATDADFDDEPDDKGAANA